MSRQNNRDLSMAGLNKITTNIAIAVVSTKQMKLQRKKLKIEWRMLRIRATSKPQFHKQVIGRGFGSMSQGFGIGLRSNIPI